MKFKIELEIVDDVNYDEIEELDTMAELFDELDEELDGWIDDKDFGDGVISRYDFFIKEVDRWYSNGTIDKITHGEINNALDYVVFDKHRPHYRYKGPK